MRIAMIGQKRVPSREGGIEVVVTELATRMVALGNSVVCYNRWEKSVQTDMPKADVYAGVKLLRVGTPRSNKLNAIVYAFRATLRALFGKYDVIHLHAEGPASMAFVTHLFRIPTVVTIHGLDWQRAKWGGFATKFLLFGEKMAARYADEVIVLTKENAKYFEDTYHRKTLYIPNGMNIGKYIAPFEIISEWKLEKHEYFLFVARLVPEKGLHYLIEAFKNTKTDKKLVIAGKINRNDEYTKSILSMAEDDERIVMTDFVVGDALKELICNAYSFVLPSDIEGMSLSLLEALSYGCRCLLSDIPENIEAAGDYACYFKHGDAKSLQDKMKWMLDNPEDKDAPLRRVDYVRRSFDWDDVTKKTLAVYDEVVARKRGSQIRRENG